MIRFQAALALSAALAVLAGCGSREMNDSKQKVNEGVELYNAGQFGQAEKKFEEATTIAEENHQAWYNLGLVREKLKKDKEAAEAFSQAVKYKEDDAMYNYRLGKAEVGQECTPSKDSKLSEAQSHLEKAVKLNDRLFKAWECLGQIYNQMDEPKKAAEAWTKSASLNPYFGRPFIALGNLYIQWDKLSEAISVLDQGRINVKDPHDQSDILYALGFAYEKQGNWDKAIDAYTQAMDKSGENIDALRQRGFAYANKGDKQKAIADLQAFVKTGGGGNAFEIQAANERLMRLMMSE